MVEDITKRKQAEEKVKTFALAIENSYDGVLLTDLSGNITFANQTALGVLGYTWDELRQLNVAQLDESPDTAKKIMEEMMSDGGWSGELVSRKKNGELFPAFVTTSRVKDDKGNIVALMSHFRDISEHKQIEAALRATEAELVHVSRIAVLGQITAAVAHEVNQPLGAILNRASEAQMILSQSNPDIKKVQTILSKIVAEDERAGSVIRKIRELAKKDARQNELLDVDIIIRQVVTIINSRAILKGAKVNLDLRPPQKFVLGDKIQLQQVVLNLITNALEAGVDKSARKIQIISEVRDSGLVTVSVSDSGLGINEGEIEKLFQPFYTTKTEGLGIGLFICRSIIQAHGGSLSARNNPDKGATFFFSLPIAQESEGDAIERT
jgi:PAS domain S-box-containing protein